MSTSLATLAPDCIATLIQCLNGDDFISLMQTGNRLLRHKLANNCFGLSFFARHGKEFPFAAFRLPKLKSLEMIPTQGIVSYLDFSKTGELALAEGCKSLEKLDLRFRNSYALFHAPGTSLPRLTVRDRFPSLTTLILQDIDRDVSMESLFGELPETLKTFSLKYDRFGDYIDMSSIAMLPRHLKSLELRHICLSHPLEPGFKLETIFPPNLVDLCLDQLACIRILDYLPSTLQNLQFDANQPNPSTALWKTSKIPKGLLTLKLGLTSRYIEVDAPLPPNLQIYELPSYLAVGDAMLIDCLPKDRFKRFSQPYFEMGSTADLDSVLPSLSSLEYARILGESSIALLPATLKTLECTQPIRLDVALPSALTELSLCLHPDFHSMSDILKNIPTTLTSLSIVPGEELVLINLSNRCTESDIAHIATRMRLTSFMIDWRLLESVTCLSPIAKMKTLKNFTIREVSWDGVVTSPKWLLQYLPSNLRQMQFISASNLEYIRTASEKFIFPLWDLETATPSLKSLDISFNHRSEANIVSLLPSFFASLPRGLLKLSITCQRASMSVDALAQLPISLQSLRLIFMRLYEPLLNVHFNGLPSSLANLDVSATELPDIDAGLFEILPNSIVSASVTKYEGKRKAKDHQEPFKDSLERFLASNRSRYFHSRPSDS